MEGRLLPKKFCWSKIGAESGEGLDLILRRKELERQAGAGLFLWGIGNSVVKAVYQLSKEASVPEVIFSPIKSKPKEIDRNPSGVVLWSHYIDQFGVLKELPVNSFVTSRYDGIDLKSARHYALFCKSSNSLLSCPQVEIFSEQLANLSTGTKLGFSQVTSVVSLKSRIKPTRPSYSVSFKAELCFPFCVKLAIPTPIGKREIEQLGDMASDLNVTAADWLNWVASIKRQYSSSLSDSKQLHLNITA